MLTDGLRQEENGVPLRGILLALCETHVTRWPFWTIALAVLMGVAAFAQQNPPQTSPPQTSPPETSAPRPARKSVPQPLQKQSLEYFVGRWNFRWLARESLLGPGSRTGTVTFTATGDGTFLDARTQGQSDEGKYQESAVVGFDNEKKLLAIFERRSGGVELLSLGDWEAAMTIRFTVSPFQVKGQTVRLKRMISVMSATTFKVSEEFSVDGGPFERLGDGTFTKIVGDGKQP